MNSCEILSGSSADLSEVMLSMGDAFDRAYGEAWTRGQCLSILGLAGVSLLLARVDEEPAGFALVRDTVGESELLLLAVRAPFRRRGIARALIERSIDAARRRGIASIHLEVRDGNPAIKLYTKLGFTRVGRRKAYYRGFDGTFYDALTMSLPVIQSGSSV